MVRVSFVNTRQNTHELSDFMNFWMDKADAVSIQNLVNLHKNTINENKFKDDFYIEIENENDKTIKFCAQPYQRLLIRNNGDITPCCRFLGLNLVFGNVFKDKIYNVYNSKEMKTFRKNLNTQNRTKICAECLDAICCE